VFLNRASLVQIEIYSLKYDEVTFELIKNAIMHYYEETNPDSYIIKIVEDKDKKGLVVSKVIRVYIFRVVYFRLRAFDFPLIRR
jgi:hypothetical protein